MKENSMPRLLEISRDEYSGSPKMVFCPVCQALVVNEEEFNECPHTLFMTASIYENEYLFMSEEFKERFEALGSNAVSEMSAREIWQHAGYGDGLAVIVQNTYGFCCGTSYAAYTGFDCSGKNITDADLIEHKQFTLRRAAELALCGEEES